MRVRLGRAIWWGSLGLGGLFIGGGAFSALTMSHPFPADIIGPIVTAAIIVGLGRLARYVLSAE